MKHDPTSEQNTSKNSEFHVTYYLENFPKPTLSGVTIEAQNIEEALSNFIQENPTIHKSLIKYILKL